MKQSNILKGICVGLFIFLNVSVTNVKAAIPDNINIWVTPKVVHIKNDDFLKKFIFLNQYYNSKQVTYNSKQIYLATYKQNILVSDTSMSVEILGHIYPDEFSKYLPSNIADGIRKHTDVIDSGEKSVDNNRWVWDSIAAVIDYFDPTNKAKKYNYEKYSTERIIYQIHQRNLETSLNNRIMSNIINDYKSNKKCFLAKFYY